MSSLDHRQKSTTEEQQNVYTNPLSAVMQHSPSDQLSFPTNSASSGGSPQNPTYQHPMVPVMTRQLHDSISSPDMPNPDSDPGPATAMTQSLIGPFPSVTRELSEVQTGELSTLSQTRTTTAVRQPVLIRGTGKKSSSPRPPKGRRLVVHVAVTAVLALIVFSALFAVLPVGGDAHNNLFKLLTGGGSGHMDIVTTKSNNTGLIAQQAATATAVTQDGYDPGNVVFAGVPTAPPDMGAGAGSGTTGNGSAIGDGTGGLSRFFYGQCTYWANMRYHALTGHFVPWLGNANEWRAGAYNYGWVVSSRPTVPSIIVLQAGVQGAGWYGHVAIVESVNPDGSVVTSNYNWAGNWARETFVTFTPGYGVSFVSHP